MKKILAAAFIICVFLVLTACDSIGNRDASNNPFAGTWNYYDNGITEYKFDKDGTVTAYRDGEEIGEGIYLWDSEGRGKLIAEGETVSMITDGNIIDIVNTYAIAYPLMRSPAANKKNNFTGTYYYNNYGEIGKLELTKDGAYTYSFSSSSYTSSGLYAVDGDSLIFMSGETAVLEKDGISINGMLWSKTAPTDLDILAGTWSHSTEIEYIAFNGVGEFNMYNLRSYEDGTYDFDGENLTIYSISRDLTGHVDEDGNLVFDDLIGYFSKESSRSVDDDEEYYTDDDSSYEIEYSIIAYGWGNSQQETKFNGDNTMTYSDYDIDLSVTYPDDMYILDGYLDGALVVAYGGYGFIYGSDVTDWYNDFSGDAIAFIEEYIWSYVIDDFSALYEPYDSYDDDVTLIKEKKSDNLAAAEINIWNMWADISAKTYVYKDINDRIIAKTIFVEYGDDDRAAEINEMAGGIVSCVKPPYIGTTAGEWVYSSGDETVIVDEEGYFTLTYEEGIIEGFCELDGNEIYVETDDDTLSGYVDESGDLIFEGLGGWFSRPEYLNTIAGIWVNPDDGDFAVFDIHGNFVLVTQGEIIIGDYVFDSDNIYIYIGDERESAVVDEDGDMLLENRDGYFSQIAWVEDGGSDGIAGVWLYSEGEDDMLILLDGEGAYELYSDAEVITGTYEFDGWEIFLYNDEDEEIIESGWIDDDGDIQFDDLDGWFWHLDLGSHVLDENAVGYIPAAFGV